MSEQSIRRVEGRKQTAVREQLETSTSEVMVRTTITDQYGFEHYKPITTNRNRKNTSCNNGRLQSFFKCAQKILQDRSYIRP